VKIFLLVFVATLSGCVAYPEPVYYQAAPAGPDPQQAQAAANAQCAKSGKVAVKTKAMNCNSSNCTTTFECQ
jgi:hypothetical protein